MKIPEDKYGFLCIIDNWASHLPLLLLALHETRNNAKPILQLGVNGDSSPLIATYCQHEGRRTVLYDDRIMETAKWLREHPDTLHCDTRCSDYASATFDRERWSVAVISHEGGRRVRDASRLADSSAIVICRDTEVAVGCDYGYEELWPKFRWRADVETSGGSWSSAVSNIIDVTKWRGLKLGPWIVSAGGEAVKEDPTKEELKRMLKEEV